ncbi:hypothetical protein JAAARDRAFT_53021 [Jaapia argillacea MUCL 33604]|uniref:F-box domain-containing protein n=1 Tax=Jaapia argillacea MUCL 33604 TaxID=933084 RepID=A0A067QDG7_9AGAM|nr:hypothetical protein JAAARDRAFT_53021 [Jaapia argillacea MUCL 33604]
MHGAMRRAEQSSCRVKRCSNLVPPRRVNPHEAGSSPSPWAPILTIPNEITVELFESCLPPDQSIAPNSMTTPLLVTQVGSHWRRIEEISLVASYPHLHEMLRNCLSTRGFSLLKVFSTRSLFRVRQLASPVIQIKPAPLLTTFILDAFIRPSPFCVPWSQLEDIDLKSFGSMWECYDVLRQCPKLLTCEFDLIVLPNLTVLKISANIPLYPLLDSLTVPRLIKLHVWVLDSSVRVPILNLITRSCCLIQSFLLSAAAISALEFIQILWSMPHLLDLLLVDSGMSFMDVTVQALNWHGDPDTEDQQQPYIVPRLQTLIILGNTRFNNAAFVDMMKSHWLVRTSGVLDSASKQRIRDSYILNPEGIDILSMPPVSVELQQTICSALATCRDEGLFVDGED